MTLLNQKTIKELKNDLKNKCLSVKGNKPDLINRFIDNDCEENPILSYPLIKKTNDNFNELTDEWFNYKIEQKEYIKSVRSILNDSVHGHDEAKLQVERIIGQWINGEMNGYCFGFEGPPGTGKTSFAKKGLTKCLKDEDGNPRPFSFIALGGSSNGATLEGHSYTYVGSNGVELLMF